MPELKPCPFCGKEVEIFDYTDRVYGFNGYQIKCKCRAIMLSIPPNSIGWFEDGTPIENWTKENSYNELVKRWNERFDNA